MKKTYTLVAVAIIIAFGLGFVAGDRWYPRNKADLNRDGVVNVYDLSIFSKNWPESQVPKIAN